MYSKQIGVKTVENLYLLIAAMVSTSLSVILRKSISNVMPPIQFEVISNVMHLVLSIAVFSAWRTQYQYVTPVTWGISAAQVVLSFITVLTFTYAIRGTNNLGSSTAIMSASPVLTLLLSSVVFGESVTLRKVLGILLVLIGTYIVTSK